jgi:hypothetical protein
MNPSVRNFSSRSLAIGSSERFALLPCRPTTSARFAPSRSAGVSGLE